MDDNLFHEFKRTESMGTEDMDINNNNNNNNINANASVHNTRPSLQRQRSFSMEVLKTQLESSHRIIQDKLNQVLEDFTNNGLIDRLKVMLNQELDGLRTHMSDVDADQIQSMLDSLSHDLELRIQQYMSDQSTLAQSMRHAMEQLRISHERDVQSRDQQHNPPRFDVDDLKMFVETTLTNQLTALQIALEKEVSQVLVHSQRQNHNDNNNNNNNNNANKDDNAVIEQMLINMKQDITEGVTKQLKELLALRRDQDAQDAGHDRGDHAHAPDTDTIMGAFRKELMPEIVALFEQMLHDSSNSNNSNTSDRDARQSHDEYKYNEREGELRLYNEQLRAKVLALEKEKTDMEQYMKDCAKSKVTAMVKLQNIIDHLKLDNQLLQEELTRYHAVHANHRSADPRALSPISAHSFSGFVGSVLGTVNSTWSHVTQSQNLST
ncbi:hypothetical protein RFI_25887 [Reticulomyxa filosa]|uniref:Uncharacterized protein n=1 Tax=Reticulomyxa filosa TaxID=46433 RepID=X6MBV3_RETFI|nr:hypothetical protein RFI_25887 [Reticulomyxa filosa]|eukprot:ETO11488.1 hypothetical protein RFI_25887 [Reticulomyxa filosa]